MSSNRKMLAVRNDLANKISEIADGRGFTLFGMTNSLLELAIKAENMGISLEEAVNGYEIIKASRDAGFTFVLKRLLYETAEIAFKKAKDKALKIWFEGGVWVARQYIARGIEDPFAAVGRDLKAFSWDTPEFTMDRLEKGVSVRVLNPSFSESYTLLLDHFLEGILETFGYSVTYKEVGRGNIRLEAVKREN